MALELCRSQAASVTMVTFRVIEELDVIKFYQAGKTSPRLASIGKRLSPLSGIAAGMDLHHLAKPPYRMLFFFPLDESGPYRDSLTKYAAAFFRMSCSSVMRFSSASRRESQQTDLLLLPHLRRQSVQLNPGVKAVLRSSRFAQPPWLPNGLTQ